MPYINTMHCKVACFAYYYYRLRVTIKYHKYFSTIFWSVSFYSNTKNTKMIQKAWNIITNFVIWLKYCHIRRKSTSITRSHCWVQLHKYLLIPTISTMESEMIAENVVFSTTAQISKCTCTQCLGRFSSDLKHDHLYKIWPHSSNSPNIIIAQTKWPCSIISLEATEIMVWWQI